MRRYWFMLLFLFGSFAAFAKANVTHVEVEVEKVSSFPQRSELAYPDCLAAVSCRVNSIIDGPATTERIECLIPIFTDYRENAVYRARFQKGNKLFLEIIPFEEADEKIRQTQQANDLTALAVQQYYVTKVNALADFSQIDFPVPFADKERYKRLWENSLNPLQDAAVWKARERRMQAKTAEVENVMKVIQSHPEMASIRASKLLDSINGKYVMHRLHNLDIAFFKSGEGIFSILPGYHPFEPIKMLDETLENIGKLNQFFLNQQIQFFVVIVPDFTAIAARAVAPQYNDVPDAVGYSIANECIKRNIEPVILAPQIQNELKSRELLYMYHNYDSHPGPGVADIGGKAMADLLGEIGIPQDENAEKIMYEQDETDQYPDWIQKELGTTEYHIRKVFSTHTRRALSLGDQEASPVLIIGNSFTRSPQGASFGHRMAWYSKVIPDLLKIEGNSMAELIPKRLLLNANRYIKGKKVCFMILAPGFLRYKWTDIQAADCLYAGISDTKVIKTFSIKDFSGSEALVPLPFCVLPGLKNEDPAQWQVFAGGKDFPNELTLTIPESVFSEEPSRKRFLLLPLSTVQPLSITVGTQKNTLYAAKDVILLPVDNAVREIRLLLKSTDKWAVGPIQLLEK